MENPDDKNDIKDDKVSALKQPRKEDGTFFTNSPEKGSKKEEGEEKVEKPDQYKKKDDDDKDNKKDKDDTKNIKDEKAFLDIQPRNKNGFIEVTMRLTGLGETTRKISYNDDGSIDRVNDTYRGVDKKVVRTFSGDLDGFIAKPVTIGHPWDDVNFDNYKTYVCGSIAKAWLVEESNEIWCKALLYGIDSVGAILNGQNSTSPMFKSVLVDDGEGGYTEEITPEAFNHIALVTDGYWDDKSDNKDYKIQIGEDTMAKPEDDKKTVSDEDDKKTVSDEDDKKTVSDEDDKKTVSDEDDKKTVSDEKVIEEKAKPVEEKKSDIKDEAPINFIDEANKQNTIREIVESIGLIKAFNDKAVKIPDAKPSTKLDVIQLTFLKDNAEIVKDVLGSDEAYKLVSISDSSEINAFFANFMGKLKNQTGEKIHNIKDEAKNGANSMGAFDIGSDAHTEFLNRARGNK